MTTPTTPYVKATAHNIIFTSFNGKRIDILLPSTPDGRWYYSVSLMGLKDLLGIRGDYESYAAYVRTYTSYLKDMVVVGSTDEQVGSADEQGANAGGEKLFINIAKIKELLLALPISMKGSRPIKFDREVDRLNGKIRSTIIGEENQEEEEYDESDDEEDEGETGEDSFEETQPTPAEQQPLRRSQSRSKLDANPSAKPDSGALALELVKLLYKNQQAERQEILALMREQQKMLLDFMQEVVTKAFSH
jgi:hypothetical protein